MIQHFWTFGYGSYMITYECGQRPGQVLEVLTITGNIYSHVTIWLMAKMLNYPFTFIFHHSAAWCHFKLSFLSIIFLQTHFSLPSLHKLGLEGERAQESQMSRTDLTYFIVSSLMTRHVSNVLIILACVWNQATASPWSWKKIGSFWNTVHVHWDFLKWTTLKKKQKTRNIFLFLIILMDT